MKYNTPVFIADGRRSPIGRFCGGLKSLSATDLVLPVAHAMVPDQLKSAVEEVILGQVLPAGSGMNVARQLVLSSPSSAKRARLYGEHGLCIRSQSCGARCGCYRLW